MNLPLCGMCPPPVTIAPDVRTDWPADATPEQAIGHARRCLGTPFHLHARVPGVGIDCVGLLIVVARACGADLPDFRNYSLYTHENRMFDAFEAMGMRRLPDRVPACVVALRIGRVNHAAIWTGGRVIHTDAGVGRVVECGLPTSWQDRIDSYFALPGVRY